MTALGIAFITLSLGCALYIAVWEWSIRRTNGARQLPARTRHHRNAYCREHTDWCRVEDDRDYV